MADTICFDKSTFYTFLFVGIGIIMYVLYNIHTKQLLYAKTEITEQLQNVSDQHQQELKEQESMLKQAFAQQMASNAQRFEDSERMVNPFVPPVQRGPLSYLGAIQTTPVGIPTRGEYGPFQQVGYLQSGGNVDHAMPLMGRRIHSNKYEYYTFHHKNPTIKIPINVKADQEIYDDSTIPVPGYTGTFTVKLYELDHPRYIPY